MVDRRSFLIVTLVVLMLFSLTFISAANFVVNGTVKDENGNILAGANVTVTIKDQATNMGLVGYNSNITNASGQFVLQVTTTAATYVYELSAINYSGAFCNFRSKIIPAFPQTQLQLLEGATFYLTPAGTINLTAVNSSGARNNFTYQIKDTKLGYPLYEEHANQTIQQFVGCVPRDRNYSVTIYPQQSMPLVFNWNGFNATQSFNISGAGNGNNKSFYNFTSKTVHKQFNLTVNMARVTGRINFTSAGFNISGWETFTIIPFNLEPNNMVHAEYGVMPANLSSMNSQSDNYTLISGYYNITLPAPVETANILLFAAASNKTAAGTNFYGGFRNISLTYGTFNYGFNFSMVGLLGSYKNITMNLISGTPTNYNATTAKQNFNLVNSTGVVFNNTAVHIEIKVDYSTLGLGNNMTTTAFTWMTDIAQTAAGTNFSIPMLNTTGIKEMNVYASGGPSGGNGQYTPKTKSFTLLDIINGANNITVTTFNPESIDGATTGAGINIALYISNSSCDVPNVPDSCLAVSSATMATFNPMKAVMGGGKLSFRMGTGNVYVHYVNVDLLASGPPDAVFDSATNTTLSTTTSFEGAARFGGSGPKIYDYALVSLPYSETAGSGLDDSNAVNMSIPVFYDDSWNQIWNSTNGTAANLAGNYSHYLDRQTEWNSLMSSTTCVSDQTLISTTSPCYIDNSTNKIWIRVPHFSGTEPAVTGSVVAAAITTTTTIAGGGSASTTTPADLAVGVTKLFSTGDVLSFKFDNRTFMFMLLYTKGNNAVIQFSPNTQSATLAVGEEKNFDLNKDGKMDISAKINSVSGIKADVTLKFITETPVAEIPVTEPETTGVGAIVDETAEKIAAWSLAKKITVSIGIIIAIALIVIGLIFLKRNSRDNRAQQHVKTFEFARK